MAIEFEFYENPDPTGNNNEEKKYHARPVIKRTVTTSEMAKNIQEASSLTMGDVKAVLLALTEEIVWHLSESNRVHIEGIGYLQTTLKTSREIEPDKTRAQSVWFKSVVFKADKSLKKRLMGVFTKRVARKSHSAALTNAEVDEKLREHFKENKILNTHTLQFICGFTKYAAIKHINRLLEEGKIENVYTKRHPVYVKGGQLAN